MGCSCLNLNRAIDFERENVRIVIKLMSVTTITKAASGCTICPFLGDTASILLIVRIACNLPRSYGYRPA